MLDYCRLIVMDLPFLVNFLFIVILKKKLQVESEQPLIKTQKSIIRFTYFFLYIFQIVIIVTIPVCGINMSR